MVQELISSKSYFAHTAFPHQPSHVPLPSSSSQPHQPPRKAWDYNSQQAKHAEVLGWSSKARWELESRLGAPAAEPARGGGRWRR